MREKILNIVYKKLSEGFKTHFFRPSEFESLFLKQYSLLFEQLTSLTKTYTALKHSENKNESSVVVKIHKEEFIIESFNKDQHRHYPREQFTVEDLEELRETKQESYRKYAELYDHYMSLDDNHYGHQFVVPLMTFVKSSVNELVWLLKDKDESSIEKLFWNYFSDSLVTNNYENRITKEKLINSPENILNEFRDSYLSTALTKLISITEKQISDIEFSGFESCIINVGERKLVSVRSGWTTNDFQVLNNGKTYKFSISAKDESKIEGKFIHIFILQLNKRHLLKISIANDETEQTPYIIYRDFEKVSLKNECEILISKHHGNETIIFDSKKEALDFQTKVLELKEGRSNNFRNR